MLLRALDIDGPGDPDEGPVAAVDRVLAYVRASCAGGPLVLVVDDMHWADATTILAWERLIPLTARLPLLLVAAARPDSNRRELSQVRRAAQVRQQRPLDLRPLAPADLERLVAHLAGAPIGEHLRALAARTGGNPLYAREMVAALLRSGAVRTAGGVAEVDATVTVEPPESLLAAVRATVDFLSPATSEVLRVAALLGNEFAVADVVAVTGQSVFELYDSLAEALAARVVVDTGENLAFRHPFLRTALNEGVPAPLRAGLHRHAAEVLAAGGRPITRVAEQLAAESPVIDGWVAGWLAEHHVELSRRAPQLAGDLMRRVLDTPVPTPAEREALLVALVRIGVGADEYPMDEAARALALTRTRPTGRNCGWRWRPCGSGRATPQVRSRCCATRWTRTCPGRGGPGTRCCWPSSAGATLDDLDSGRARRPVDRGRGDHARAALRGRVRAADDLADQFDSP